MHYKYAIIDMCDECRMTLMRATEITSNCLVNEMSRGTSNDCRVCGRLNVFTMGVLTDYRVTPIKSFDELAKTPRSISEGFMLLALEDGAAKK